MTISAVVKIACGIAVLSLSAGADDGLSTRSIDPQEVRFPSRPPCRARCRKINSFSSAQAVKTEEKNPLLLTDPNAAADQKALKKVEAKLKAGGLTDKQRFHLQLQQAQLKKKLEGPH